MKAQKAEEVELKYLSILTATRLKTEVQATSISTKPASLHMILLPVHLKAYLMVISYGRQTIRKTRSAMARLRRKREMVLCHLLSMSIVKTTKEFPRVLKMKRMKLKEAEMMMAVSSFQAPVT